jgi:hypothetical protein
VDRRLHDDPPVRGASAHGRAARRAARAAVPHHAAPCRAVSRGDVRAHGAVRARTRESARAPSAAHHAARTGTRRAREVALSSARDAVRTSLMKPKRAHGEPRGARRMRAHGGAHDVAPCLLQCVDGCCVAWGTTFHSPRPFTPHDPSLPTTLHSPRPFTPHDPSLPTTLHSPRPFTP